MMKPSTFTDERVWAVFACLLAEQETPEGLGRILRESGTTRILTFDPNPRVLGLYNGTTPAPTPLWHLRHETPAEAAEALDAEGLVPQGWFNPTPGRQHQCVCWNRAQKKLKAMWTILVNPITSTCPACANQGVVETPVDWASVLGWALEDPARVGRAEALAEVVFRRYHPAPSTPPPIVWVPLPPAMDFEKNPLRPPQPIHILPEGGALRDDGTLRANLRTTAEVTGADPTLDELLAMRIRLERFTPKIELRYHRAVEEIR